MDMPHHRSVNIRQPEKARIKDAVRPGRMLQICGPPMVGKSTIATQALTEMHQSIASYHLPGYGLIQHDFQCENLGSLQEVLDHMAEKLCPHLPFPTRVNTDRMVAMLHSILGQRPTFHHVLIFHKCQDLRTNGYDHEFVDFLRNIILHVSVSGRLYVSVVFTTYKLFPFTPPNTRASVIEIGVLTDIWDVISLLQMYAPNSEPHRYARICLETLPLPEAVRRFAEEFLVSEEFRDTPEVIERSIDTDMGFLALLFQNKMDAVEKWIPQNFMSAIVHFSHSIRSSFTEDHLRYVSTDERGIRWNQLKKFLTENYVIRNLPDADRLAIHPLVVYFCTVSRRLRRLALQGHWYDHSCNKFVQFLCHVLDKTETSMRLHGNRGQVYGCLQREWPHVRYMIDMALHCNENTYKSFLKAAVSARGIIIRSFLHESYDFYNELYNSAKKYGTSRDCAVLQSLIGHTMASSSRLATGLTWQDAENTLDRAMETLQMEGPAFAYNWAMHRKAIILHRQGKYREALEYFQQAKRVTVTEIDDGSLEEAYGVSPLQVKEEKITQAIFEANSLIGTQQTQRARVQLYGTRQQITDEYADHPELATLLNSLGLVDDREGNRGEAVIWYKESLTQRRYLSRIYPEILVIPLCNIGKLYMRQGNLREGKKYLSEALSIREKHGVNHADTALTLKYMAQLAMKSGDFAQAFKHTKAADQILLRIAKKHDSRIELNIMLAHQRQMLELGDDRGRCATLTNPVGLIKNMGNLEALASEGLDRADLVRSSQDYFEIALVIAEPIKKILIDEGHDGLLLAHEHAMMFHLKGSREKFDEHLRAIVPYMTMENICRGQKKVEATREYLQKHRDLFTFIRETEYGKLDKREFLQHLVKACYLCRESSSLIACPIEELWFPESRRRRGFSNEGGVTPQTGYPPDRNFGRLPHNNQPNVERRRGDQREKESYTDESFLVEGSQRMGASAHCSSNIGEEEEKSSKRSDPEETKVKAVISTVKGEMETRKMQWSDAGQTETNMLKAGAASETIVKALNAADASETDVKSFAESYTGETTEMKILKRSSAADTKIKIFAESTTNAKSVIDTDKSRTGVKRFIEVSGEETKLRTVTSMGTNETRVKTSTRHREAGIHNGQFAASLVGENRNEFTDMNNLQGNGAVVGASDGAMALQGRIDSSTMSNLNRFQQGDFKHEYYTSKLYYNIVGPASHTEELAEPARLLDGSYVYETFDNNQSQHSLVSGAPACVEVGFSYFEQFNSDNYYSSPFIQSQFYGQNPFDANGHDINLHSGPAFGVYDYNTPPEAGGLPYSRIYNCNRNRSAETPNACVAQCPNRVLHEEPNVGGSSTQSMRSNRDISLGSGHPLEEQAQPTSLTPENPRFQRRIDILLAQEETVSSSVELHSSPSPEVAAFLGFGPPDPHHAGDYPNVDISPHDQPLPGDVCTSNQTSEQQLPQLNIQSTHQPCHAENYSGTSNRGTVTASQSVLQNGAFGPSPSTGTRKLQLRQESRKSNVRTNDRAKRPSNSSSELVPQQTDHQENGYFGNVTTGIGYANGSFHTRLSQQRYGLRPRITEQSNSEVQVAAGDLSSSNNNNANGITNNNINNNRLPDHMLVTLTTESHSHNRCQYYYSNNTNNNNNAHNIGSSSNNNNNNNNNTSNGINSNNNINDDNSRQQGYGGARPKTHVSSHQSRPA